MTKPLLTTTDVAAQLGVSVRTIHRMAKAGTLPYVVKVPGETGAYLFDPAVIDARKEGAA